MIDYKYADLFLEDSIDKQITIKYDGGTIGNEELFSESMELSEGLCSESALRFGCCEASELKFKVANIMIPLGGKWITVSEILNRCTDEAFPLGRYKVYSDKSTADRRYREVTAYDAMYDIINADVTDWYNTILPDMDSTMTMKQFRTSFVAYFGLEQEETELVNDGMIIEKTIVPSEISGKDVITAICEINGCFGHIGRNGKFQYIYLKQNIQEIYPRDDLYPADDLFPNDPDTQKIGKSVYISCQYEDFITKGIEKLQIRQEENDIGIIRGEGDNCYIIEDNFLVYGKSGRELENIAENILSVIRGVSYRPFSAEVKGNPCLEAGDAVRLQTRYEIIESYILKRTLKGIQALRDTYEAEGEEYYSEKVNSVNKSIVQLKGKTNTLTRTVEETRLEMKDIEKGLKSQITQTVEQIRLEVEDTKNGLQSQITQNAGNICLKVSKDSVVSEINQSAETITIKAAKIDLQGLVNATEFTSKYATIDSLNVTNNLVVGVNDRVTTIANDYVKTGQLEAVSARISKVEADYISAGTVKANYMEVANWTNGGYIKAGKISADNITAGTLSVDRLDINGIVTAMQSVRLACHVMDVETSFYLNGKKWTAGTINGISCLVEDR